MQITFWMSYAAASNATLNLTLADGTTTGAIPCYYSGTTRLGTHYAAGNAVHFTYRENVTIGTTTVAHGWWADANYSVSDTNYDIIGTSIPIRTRLNAYCLCGMVGTSGTIAKQTRTVGDGTYWEINAFTQSSGTGQTKKLIPNQGYYPGKIFYYTGSSAITDADSVSGTISGGTNNLDLRYTVNGSSSANIGVTGAPFFLVGSLGSDGLFYLNGHEDEAVAEWWQCGFPTDLTSTYVYWFVGMMTSKYQCRLSDHNWMLKSDGTKWIVFDGAKKVHWDNIEGKPTSFTPASHTHGYISNDGSIPAAIAANPASGDKIVITDSSDSDKVKGSITIGSDDGKFLKHDGTWGMPDDHILVMTGTITSTSSPITTTTSWTDFVNAVNNRDRLVVEIDGTAVNINLQVIGSEIDDPSPWVELTGNALMPSGTRSTNLIISMKATPQDNNVSFIVDTSIPTVVLEAEFAGTASTAYSVAWSGIEMNPYPTTAPSTDGNYSLNVSGGTTSWTTASSGLQPPGSPGDYYLNDDGAGNTTWMPISGASVDHASTADSASSVNWSDVTGTPTIPNTPDAPATDGEYVLQVTGGGSSNSWSPIPSIPDTPDAPASDGNYVLNVDSGSGSWLIADPLIIDFDTVSSNIFTCTGVAWATLCDALPIRKVIITFSAGGTSTASIRVHVTGWISGTQSGQDYIAIQGMGINPYDPLNDQTPSVWGFVLFNNGGTICANAGDVIFGHAERHSLSSLLSKGSYYVLHSSSPLSNGLLDLTVSAETLVNGATTSTAMIFSD